LNHPSTSQNRPNGLAHLEDQVLLQLILYQSAASSDRCHHGKGPSDPSDIFRKQLEHSGTQHPWFHFPIQEVLQTSHCTRQKGPPVHSMDAARSSFKMHVCSEFTHCRLKRNEFKNFLKLYKNKNFVVSIDLGDTVPDEGKVFTLLMLPWTVCFVEMTHVLTQK
jgi:hypothetical protein